MQVLNGVVVKGRFRSSSQTLKKQVFLDEKEEEIVDDIIKKKRYKNVIVRFQEANLSLAKVLKYYMQNLEIPTR